VAARDTAESRVLAREVLSRKGDRCHGWRPGI